MSILIDNTTRIITQGVTGEIGSFGTSAATTYGAQIFGGVKGFFRGFGGELRL